MGTAPEASEVGTCEWVRKRPGGRAPLVAALEERRRRAGGRAGEQGGWGPPERGGGSVTTRLDRSNYNPAVAPAYRATSDPSKRVAWEFGWRQRLAGGGARRGDHRLCAPSPAVWEERLCGGWEKGAGENATRPQRVLSLTPLGLSLRPRELRTAQQAGIRALLHRTHSGGSKLDFQNSPPSSST